jgi:hypothetical protein
MSLPLAPNVTVDIFRHGGGPGGTPAVAALAAYLTPRGNSNVTTAFYTHLLYVPSATDIRDAYVPGSLTPGSSPDVVYYPAGGSGNPYTVVLVREWNIGGALDHIEVLLVKGAL